MIDKLHEIQLEHPLDCEFENDARYVWPQRWELAAEVIADLQSQHDTLKATAALHDELVTAGRKFVDMYIQDTDLNKQIGLFNEFKQALGKAKEIDNET